jgi:hypothetical protein
VTSIATNADASLSQYDEKSTKRKEDSKLTKHGFLDKIKSAAATASSENANNTAKIESQSITRNEKNVAKWGALSEDYLLGSKKVRAPSSYINFDLSSTPTDLLLVACT